jgi:hypothetical protein
MDPNDREVLIVRHFEEPSSADPIGAIADEFVAAFRHGQAPSVEEIARRYPAHADKIREILPALLLMEQAKCSDVAAAHSVRPTRRRWRMTQGQWQAIMGDNPSSFSRFGTDRSEVKPGQRPTCSRPPLFSRILKLPLVPALLGGGLASIGPADSEAATQEFAIGAGSGQA